MEEEEEEEDDDLEFERERERRWDGVRVKVGAAHHVGNFFSLFVWFWVLTFHFR